LLHLTNKKTFSLTPGDDLSQIHGVKKADLKHVIAAIAKAGKVPVLGITLDYCIIERLHCDAWYSSSAAV
jgi:hypothetical protein